MRIRNGNTPLLPEKKIIPNNLIKENVLIQIIMLRMGTKLRPDKYICWLLFRFLSLFLTFTHLLPTQTGTGFSAKIKGGF